MAERVTLLDSLIITVFSMAVVFVVLIAIAFLIRVLKAVSTDEKKEETSKQEVKVQTSPITQEKEVVQVEDEEELVAVISAAIAASLGVSIPEINIRTIRRLNESVNSWAQVARTEQIMKRL